MLEEGPKSDGGVLGNDPLLVDNLIIDVFLGELSYKSHGETQTLLDAGLHVGEFFEFRGRREGVGGNMGGQEGNEFRSEPRFDLRGGEDVVHS